MTLCISIFGEEKCNLTSLVTVAVIIFYFSVRSEKKINVTDIKFSVRNRAKFIDFLSINITSS